MVILSKKDARKAQPQAPKGKAKASGSTTKPASAKKVKVDQVDEEESSEDEDEDANGVSEEGLKRLMGLVNEEDLDEYELAVLGEDGVDDEDEEDDEEDEEMVSGEEALSDESENEDEDEEEVPLDNTIVDERADDDAISLDGLGSDVSVDEDAVPQRKVTINNKPAMRLVTDAIKVTNMPWPETLVLSTKDKVEADANDDLQREMAFYKIALDCVPQAKKLAAKHDIPFSRPGDYYAEMVKSDEHMERVRSKLVEESQGIKKSEAAKKQRELKKFGKQIQHEKLKQREQDKKTFQDRVQGIKRKRKEGMDVGEDDGEFDISVEHAVEDRAERGERGGRGGRGGADKGKMPRHVRDSKYSLGGSSRRAKQNTKESTNDFSAFNGGRPGRGGARGGFGGRGGGRGGGGGGRGGSGGGGGRPGKSRRQAGRV